MFLLLTTSIVDEGESGPNLLRLVNSLIMQNVRVQHVILLQNPDKLSIPSIPQKSQLYTSSVISIAEKVSLSKARNQMIDFCVEERMLTDNNYVGFPDDDCWYTEDLLNFISQPLKENSFVFLRYGSQPSKIKDEKIYKATWSSIVKNASSNTVFFSADLIEKVGHFDPRLGVGAEYNGGEDLDYSLRAFSVLRSGCFIDQKAVGHRDKVNDLRSRYFQGSYIALGKQKFASVKSFLQFCRKFAIGIFLILFSSMPISKILKTR